MIPRGGGCGRGTVKDLKTVANVNDSKICLVLSPAVITAAVIGANTPIMTQSEASKWKTKHLTFYD